MPTKHQETAITGAFNILLVEDDAELAQALERELTLLDHRITTVVDGRQAFEAITRNSFDAAILDRMLPDADGLETLRRLRDGHVTLPILMLTAMGRSSEKIEGLFAGADDYVAKPVTAAEIDARLRALIRARQWTSKEADTISAGDIVVSPTKFRAWRKGKALDLPTLELELLAELARNVDAVMTRAMLLERVWKYDFHPDMRVVDVYIRRLRVKLTENGDSDPIATVRGVGYVLRG